MNRLILSFLIIAAATVSFASSAFAFDDPPTRAGRLSYIKGDVSLQPGDTDDWTWASMNRPVTTGDNIWVSRRGRAEIRIGSAAIRADQKTSLSLLNLGNDDVQLGLNSGTIIVHLRSLPKNGYFEIDTPNAAVSLLRAGDYRIETDETGDFTRVAVRTGKAAVDGSRDSFRIAQGSEAEITGSYKIDYDVYDLSPSDEFDRWSRQRDFRSARSVSARYVSTELTGYEDLDQSGQWFNDATYGNVWQPRNVSSTWTPYREGRWAWVDPWGWTWMDDQPWGYATSHYGRWANLSGRGWAWVPPQRNAGSVAYVPVYSPANVVFIRETRVVYRDRPTIAWFPLGPGEAYVPAYRSSRDYLARINDTNTNWRGRDRDRYDYNQRRYVSQRDYSNVLIAGAVVAVASEIFSSSKPVHRSAVRVDNATFMSKEVARTAPIAPVKASVLAGSMTTAATTAAAPIPPKELRERKVVAKKEPPPRRIKFDRKQAELQKTEGAPIDTDAEKKLSKGTSAPAPSAVTVVQTPAAQAPAAEVAPKERNEQQRAERAERREQREDVKENRAESKQQREAERAAEKAEADKLRAEEEAQQKVQQSQQQQQADQARQQRETDRDAAKQQAEQQRDAEEAQRKAERDQQQQQRDADRQKAEQQRAAEDAQRKAQKEEADQQREAAKQQADQQRAEEETQRKAEKEEADKQRAAEQAQQKAEQEQKREEAEQARQQKQEEERAAREAKQQSRQPAGEADQPDATAEPDQATTEEPVRRHKGQSPRRRGDDAEQPEQGATTAPVEAPAQPEQHGSAEPAPPPSTTASGPVRMEAGDAEQKLVSQPKLKYPREAEKAGVEGTVKVQTTIGTDGRVKDAIAIEGPDELKDAARENVARRRYQPTVVDGKAVEVQTDVSVDFKKE
ncbi:MAG: TonB family protein [Alphaproteobacteria bacterium]